MTGPSDLPPCRHRGEVAENRCRCRSDRLIHSGTVSFETCRQCPYADQPLLAELPTVKQSQNRTECRHRGEQLRLVNCPSCPGRTDVKVFACEVHAECTAAKQIEGIRTCRACEQYEAASVETPTGAGGTAARRVIIEQHLAPGDTVVLGGALRALHDTYPGAFITDVRAAGAREIFEHHPLVTALDEKAAGVERVTVHYSDQSADRVPRYAHVNQSNQRPLHFLEAQCEGLGVALGLDRRLTPTVFRGDIHLSAAERRWHSQVQEITGRPTRYWILNAGRKSDFTCKLWPPEHFQEVVDRTKDRVRWVQIGAADPKHHHPPLDGVFLDLRGRTDLRQLIRLVYHAEGVLTGVSMPMHLAAAVPRPAVWGEWPRPCVVVGGGREPVSWNQYPGQQYLHTVGALDCCRSGGCWKSRVEQLGDGEKHDGSICSHAEAGAPKCMRMIGPDEVVRAIERFLD